MLNKAVMKNKKAKYTHVSNITYLEFIILLCRSSAQILKSLYK